MLPLLWSHRLRGAAGGLVLARESGHVLAWDTNHWLVLFNRRGEVQAQSRFDAGMVAAGIAEDGSALAVADDRGQVAWLTRDLSPRWQRSLPHPPTALAIDPLGRGLAVADAGCRLHFFDVAGQPIGPPRETPRLLVQLLFASTAPMLFAAADFGLVTALDPRSGQSLWQDVPIAHLGTLAASDGPTLTIGCFSEGVRRYGSAGQRLPTLPTPEPCRFVATTFDGRIFLTGGVFGAVHGLSDGGTVQFAHHFNQPVIALALAPLGDWAALALLDGLVLSLDLEQTVR